MKQVKTATLVLAALALSACSSAKQASEVEASFVAQDKYRSMSCRALRGEAERVKESVEALGVDVDKAYKDDKTMEAVTWILFWPAVFAMDGNEGETSKLASAKGEAEAISATMKAKGCRM